MTCGKPYKLSLLGFNGTAEVGVETSGIMYLYRRQLSEEVSIEKTSSFTGWSHLS
jgi:hypothetical protein